MRATRPAAAPLLLTLAALLLNGCIRMEQIITLRADGSGTMDLTYSIAEESVTQIEAMRKLEEEMEAASDETLSVPPAEDDTRLLFSPTYEDLHGRLKSYERLGIRVEKLEVKSREARRQVHVKLAFTNLAAAAHADLFRKYGFSLTRLPDGDYRVFRPPMTSAAPAVTALDQETERVLTPFLAGLSVSLTLHPPGRIISTTAPIKSATGATWMFEFDRDPNVLAALQREKFEIVFAGKDLNLPTFEIPFRPPTTAN
jgi:hypothetical protein